jgi:hypothetical protein
MDRSKMSVADMLAAARAGGDVGAAPAEATTQPEAAPAEEVAAAAPVVETPADSEVAAPSGKTIRRVDKSGMSIDDIIAYCRQHDAK